MARNSVLVTGAGGFIGRWSVPPLLAAGYDVHAVVSRAAGVEVPAQLRGAEIHRVDLLEARPTAALVRAVAASHLLHFAWIATPGVYWTSPENQRWLAAGQRLMREFESAGGVRAVMSGSCAEYDWSRGGVCNERLSPLADESGAKITAYAKCKIAMQKALASADARGLSTAWGRIFFQFGPNENPERLVASVIVSLLSGREALCSHGRQIRSFLHVADVGAAFATLLDSKVRGPVNIGSDERTSVAQLIDRIGVHIGRPELVRLGARPAPPHEPPLLVPDAERLYRELGWRPHFNLEQAITDTVEWWRTALAAGKP